MQSRCCAILAAVVVAAAVASQARAEADPEPARFPFIRGEIQSELQLDRDSESQRSHAYTKVEPGLTIGLSEQLSVRTRLVLEPVRDPPAGRDVWFEDQGIFLETLSLHWRSGRLALHGGKFNPAFGFAWDLAPGIYGVEFAEDYELTERIGFGAGVELGNVVAGSHWLGADVFFADTSALSGSLLNDRGRLRRSDGGPSNTGAPESFALALQGEAMPRLPGLTYNLGFARLQRANADERSEHDAVAGLGYAHTLGQRFEIQLLSEYAYLDNAGGEDERRHYLTQGAALYWGPLNLALAYTGRWIRTPGVELQRDFLVQASAGLARGIGADGRFGVIGADVGWVRRRDAGEGRDGFGARIRYAIAF
jgi:hypothetical protein